MPQKSQPISPIEPVDREAADYAPYAQLIKMLVPSSGSVAIHDPNGEILWCSEGFERPDLRELVDQVNTERFRSGPQAGRIMETSTGLTVFASPLLGPELDPLGCVLVELGKHNSHDASRAVAPSLLRPVIECLAARMALERGAPPDGSERLELLLLDDEPHLHEASALQKLVTHCVENLGCASGALVVPERNLSVTWSRQAEGGEAAPRVLDRAQKHVLAWLQLNDRSMIVNQVSDIPNATPYKILSCPVRDAHNRVTGLFALFRPADAPNFELPDVRILEFMSRKAVTILNSQHDALTGLANPTHFERGVQQRVQSGPAAAPFALLYLDIDGMQRINEAFGFHSGDEVIQRIAELIRGALDGNGLSTRVRGDRFAVFVPGAGVDEATRLASELTDAISRLSFVADGETLPVSVCIGFVAPPPGERPLDVEHLLAAAELACKSAKRRGAGSVEAYEDGGVTSLHRQGELLATMSVQQALKNNELQLEAQPIIGLSREAGGLMGFEALVRMRDPGGRLLAPDKFFAAAQRCGLMPALDRWVICGTLRELRDAPRTLRELPLGIGINVSAETLISGDFTDFLQEELTRNGLPAELVCLEIKESAALNHVRDAERLIGACRQIGCRVALDDFGRGLSSLAHLKDLPVQHVKIDGSLIRRVLDDRYAESMVAGLIAAARTLGVTTVAEHVETEALAKRLAELEVDCGQGFHFARPAPFARVIDENLEATG
jgi:diguanylate cyclase (GGDEF)-like protein